MVKFIDLEEEDGITTSSSGGKNAVLQRDYDRPDPNHSLHLSIVLACYPIVSQLARYVDTNTLHELSRTCRKIRADLIIHRKSLMTRTLTCENEDAHVASRLSDAYNTSVAQWNGYISNESSPRRITSGRVTTCARDMVGECRRCARIVCRNCVMKAPSSREVRSRHRRLCRTCMKCSLAHHTVSAAPTRSVDEDTKNVQYAREPCTCEERSVWICQPCSLGLKSADTTYLRGWSWRTRYSACGGIGAGLGQGNEGVECGRYKHCFAAREVEREIECDADELAAQEAVMEKAGHDGRKLAGGSYFTSEIVGIGGKVKKKLKQEVLVGQVVKEYEEERLTGKFLKKEQEGTNRSWCSWCARVVPGKKDTDPSENDESIATPASSAPQTPSVHEDAIKINPLRVN